MVAASLLVVWLWLAPLDLYPRFLIWLAPAVAIAVAAAVRRAPLVALPLVAVAAVLMVRIDRAHGARTRCPTDRRRSWCRKRAAAARPRACCR